VQHIAKPHLFGESDVVTLKTLAIRINGQSDKSQTSLNLLENVIPSAEVIRMEIVCL
jgi:hypothetical protein